MAQSHTAQELEQILHDHKPQELLKAFKAAWDIPLIHLAKQFVSPGIKDVDVKDEKTKDEKAKDEKSAHASAAKVTSEQFPDLTRDQAFSRLRAGRLDKISAQERSAFLPWINELLLKEKKDPLTTEERIILGMAYENGLGITADEKIALKYYQAAAQDSAYGLFLLGISYQYLEEEDLEESFFYCKSAIKKANLGAAHYVLGYMYREGVLVKIDHAKSFYHLQLAAQTKDALGLTNLGHNYENGLGTVKNMIAAAQLYIAAIQQGCTAALNNFALCSLQHDAIQQLQFYLIGAEAGLRHCAYNAGMSFQLYIINLTRAAFYFRLAYVLNYEDALPKLDSLSANNLTDVAITYHHAMAHQNINALCGMFSTNPVVFNQLWAQDFYCDHAAINQQALDTAIAIFAVKPALNNSNFSPIPALLAIHYFEQTHDVKDNDNIEKASQFLKNLKSSELAPAQNYGIGYWLYTHAEIYAAPLLAALKLQVKSKDEKHEKVVVTDIHAKKELRAVAIDFLKAAAEKKLPEAITFLTNIQSENFSQGYAVYGLLATIKDSKEVPVKAIVPTANPAP